MSKQSNIVIRIVKGFFMFWWDFLVGDTPELFVAALVIIGAVFLVSERHHLNTTAIWLLPLLAVAALGTSVYRAQRGIRKK